MVMGSAAPGDQRLRGRVGIITGAASGIGAAGAGLFAIGEIPDLVMPDGYKRSVAAWSDRLDARPEPL